MAPLFCKPVRRLFSEKETVLFLKKTQVAIDTASFAEDFQQIYKQTPPIKYLDPALYTIRWQGIYCPQKTAIPLHVANGVKYLHANRVDMEDSSKYMAVQLPGTSEQELFTKLVHDEAGLIVDLTNDHDKAQDTKGTAPFMKQRYFPKTVGKTRSLNLYSVTCTAAHEQGPIAVYTYDILDKSSGQTKSIKRVHYTQWPDHGVISAKSLQELIQTVDTHAQKNGQSRILVHCRGGVGRTGTFITARTLMNLKNSGQLSVENFKDRTREIILNGRSQRGIQFVQEPGQLKLLYEYGKTLF